MNVEVTIKVLMLLFLVGISTYTDVKDRRIPNKVTFPFAFAGLIVNAAFDFPNGIKTGLFGFGFGFAIFFIPYLMGAMGAGDIKLMAAVGAITNVKAMFYITILTTLVGGLIIVAVRLKDRQLLHTVKRMGKLILFYIFSLIYMFAKHPKVYMWKEDNRLDMTDDKIDFIPYGVAIAGGTVLTIFLSVYELVPQLYL